MKLSQRLLFASSCLLLSSCGFLRIARTPMERVAFREVGPAQARGAIVLLPGFGDRPEAFREHGFVSEVARVAPDYDVFGADAHFGYYRKGIVVERLEEDVIGPLKARGYREIWVMGASMGGHGAVAYARHHPDKVRGVMLFAPYMGPKNVVTKVAASGLCKYDETPGKEDNADDFARLNFLWLKREACQPGRVSLWLGVGDADRLQAPDQLLGQELDPAHVVVLPGGHGWKVWTPAVSQLAKTAFDSHDNLH